MIKNFERVKKSILTHDPFQQTLIYSGKVGNKINIGYREFSNGLARSAFNNNVEYDLFESAIIGYKGAQLEILEATNQYIKYGCTLMPNFGMSAPIFGTKADLDNSGVDILLGQRGPKVVR